MDLNEASKELGAGIVAQKPSELSTADYAVIENIVGFKLNMYDRNLIRELHRIVFCGSDEKIITIPMMEQYYRAINKFPKVYDVFKTMRDELLKGNLNKTIDRIRERITDADIGMANLLHKAKAMESLAKIMSLGPPPTAAVTFNININNAMQKDEKLRELAERIQKFAPVIDVTPEDIKEKLEN